MTEDWISTLLSPAFVTFKERAPSSRTKHPQLQECLETCDLVGLTASLDLAISIIPAPEYPEAASKIEEFHARYGWVNTQLSDGSLIKGVPLVSFDSHPNSDGRIKDHQLFGESYLVLWLCPVDRDAICEHLQSQIKYLKRNRLRSTSYSRFWELKNEWNSSDLLFTNHAEDVREYLRQELIERLCLLEPVENKGLNAIRCEIEREFDDLQFKNI